MNSLRLWTLVACSVAGAAGCYSGDGPDIGGGCASCVLETGDYEYSSWTVASDTCGFDFTNPDGGSAFIEVSGEDFILNDFLEGTVTNGHAEGTYSTSFDLYDDGYDCVLDYDVALEGVVPEDGVLKVSSYTYQLTDGGGSECDVGVQDVYDLSGVPCDAEATYTLTLFLD